ncbi:MAG: enolase C-terminal domain-like protein [Ilumatobacteraceae bacterium]
MRTPPTRATTSATSARLDEFDLLLIEQPLAEDDLLGHVQLAQASRTPVCLDESIHSLRIALDAIELGACSIVNIKPGRVGGYLEARRIHDACAAREVAVWCGGMLETGIGRAANVALAALAGFHSARRHQRRRSVLAARHRRRSDRDARRRGDRAVDAGPRLRARHGLRRHHHDVRRTTA